MKFKLTKKTAIIGGVVLLLVIGAAGKGKSNDTPTERPSRPSKSESSTDDVTVALPVEFVGDVPNDVTGNWRYARCSESLDMSECAVEYYNTYFKNNDEIHFIINTADNTTTKLSYLLSSIDVSVYEYVQNEETDAKLMPSGELKAEYSVEIETGKIEKIK